MLQRRPNLYVIEVRHPKDLRTILRSFADTVETCPGKTRPGTKKSFSIKTCTDTLISKGFYHPNNAFVYMLSNQSKNDTIAAKDLIFSSSLVKKHRYVAVFTMIDGTEKSILDRYNYYTKSVVYFSVVSLAKNDSQVGLSSIFEPFDMQVIYTYF